MLPNGFSKLVPRWKKTKQLQYSRDFTVMLIIQMLLMLMYAFFHSPSIFRAKNYLFCTLCAYAWHRLRPYLIFYTGKKNGLYCIYRLQETNRISVHINFTYLFPVWLCDEWTVCMETDRTWYYSCPWAGDKSIFLSFFLIGPHGVTSLYWRLPCI